MAYMFAKPLELLMHMLGSPKCVVARISGCPDMFDVKRNFMVTVLRTGTFLVFYNHNPQYIKAVGLVYTCHGSWSVK